MYIARNCGRGINNINNQVFCINYKIHLASCKLVTKGGSDLKN